MAYAYRPPPYGYVPVYPPSVHNTPIVQAGALPLPTSPFAHHDLLSYGYGGYCAPYFRPSPTSMYGAGGLPLPAAYQPFLPYGGSTQLHGLLHYSRNPRLRFDLAAPLDAIRHADGLRLPTQEENASACLPETRIFRIVCAQLPWVIDIDTTDGGTNMPGRPVTVSDILSRVHAELRVRVTPSEYLIADKKKREAVANAFTKRTDGNKDEAGEGIKRVDWLEGTSRFFMGLTKDDRVVKEIIGGRDQIPETWVMIVGSL